MTIPEMIATAQIYAAEADAYMMADGKSAYALTSIALTLAAAVQILDKAFGPSARQILMQEQKDAGDIENLYNQIEELRVDFRNYVDAHS